MVSKGRVTPPHERTHSLAYPANHRLGVVKLVAPPHEQEAKESAAHGELN